MTGKLLIYSILLFGIISTGLSQNYSLGESLNPIPSQFELLGISSKTGVATYRYKKPISARFYGRQLSDIVVGVKDGYIAHTIYLMIPENGDIGVPKEILNLIQAVLPFPLSYINGIYGINIDNYSITISRSNNSLTFNQDRIMYFSSIKYSILTK